MKILHFINCNLNKRGKINCFKSHHFYSLGLKCILSGLQYSVGCMPSWSTKPASWGRLKLVPSHNSPLLKLLKNFMHTHLICEEVTGGSGPHSGWQINLNKGMGEKSAQKGTQEARFLIQLSYQTRNNIKHVKACSFPQNMSFTSLMALQGAAVEASSSQEGCLPADLAKALIHSDKY